MGGENQMSIDKTIRTLAVLGETIKDELTAEKKDDMSEVHLIAVSAEDYRAITDAVAALKGIRILNGIFKDEEGQG